MPLDETTLMILRCVAVTVGALLGVLLAGLVIFENRLLPMGHFLILPAMLIGASTMGLVNGYFDEEYLPYFALFETICDIGLCWWKIKEDRNQKK
jgi:hypothetical protein